MATASQPAGSGVEIEAADDFILNSQTAITSATFTELLSGAAVATINDVVVEIYRVFPLDSNTNRIPNVPTRANSPADVVFTSLDSINAGTLQFTTAVLSNSFTANNSVLNGIHPSPNQTTGGEGPVSGTEVQFSVNFPSTLQLPAGQHFFVPQVEVNNGGHFFWLSAPRPIVPPGTPFAGDLQEWIRNDALAPDWLRVGTDIVGGAQPPTFNGAFSLTGITVPDGPLPLNLNTMPPGDFNHNGVSDTITLSTDGTLQIFSTTNGAIAQVFNIGKVGINLTFDAVGSFFGANAASDFILRGPQGQTELFQVNNDAIANVIQEGNIGTDFQIVSVGDYFQSGTDAFVTRSVNTGAMELYKLNNGLVTNAFSLGQVGPDQQVIGQGNFFNNGTEDLAFEQTGTGLLDLYQIKNGQIVGFNSLGAIGGSEHIVGLGDFNGDGTTDMLERGDDGSMRILEIGNGQVVGVSNLGQIGLEFQPAGVGDFFGNGTDDFMMRSGQLIQLYKVNNDEVVNVTTYGVTGTNVQLAGAYFNHLV